MQFFPFVKETSEYVPLNSVIPSVVAFIVVIEMELSDISYIFFSIFGKKLSLPAEKNF